ncbi:MAG: hypothetical protein BYD32DRAFT_17117 [Podila humilis]|nr:MAG: hypothetical protein BYD32DRAFT_17117 [Podila humilis]
MHGFFFEPTRIACFYVFFTLLYVLRAFFCCFCVQRDYFQRRSAETLVISTGVVGYSRERERRIIQPDREIRKENAR